VPRATLKRIGGLKHGPNEGAGGPRRLPAQGASSARGGQGQGRESIPSDFQHGQGIRATRLVLAVGRGGGGAEDRLPGGVGGF